MAKEMEQGVTTTLFIISDNVTKYNGIYKFVTTNTFNCHKTIAFI